MKYIRTKNFIHDSKDVVVVNENGTLVVIRGIDKDFVERTRGKTWNTGTNVVLAQADTIDELCDEIVVVNNWGKHTTQHFCDRLDRSTFVGNEKPCELNNTKVFGAIWTDKGLIYVAKMNDKGELELL